MCKEKNLPKGPIILKVLKLFSRKKRAPLKSIEMFSGALVRGDLFRSRVIVNGVQLIRQEWSWLNAKIKRSMAALRGARTRELQFACFYAVRSLQQARTRATVGKVCCFPCERPFERLRMDKLRRRSAASCRVSRLGQRKKLLFPP